MNTYRVPKNHSTQSAYYDKCSSLPWVFNATSSGLSINPMTETVMVDGTLDVTGTDVTFLGVGSMEPPGHPAQWLLDTGPFYDRFLGAKSLVLGSTDPGILIILKDISPRKWVDLTLPQVGNAVAYIGSVIPQVSASLRFAIMNTVPTFEEQRALRTLYFP